MTFSWMDRAFSALKALRTPAKVAGAVLLASSFRCAGADSDEAAPSGDGDELNPGERKQNPLDVDFHYGGESGEGVPLHPLCGVGECIPDQKSSCFSAGGAGGANDGSLGGQAGGLTYDPGDLGVQGLTCRVQREVGCEGEDCAVERACGPHGGSDVGEPCVSQTDCAAGLACVGEGGGGICRPYCCQGTSRSCSDGMFCDERSFAESPEIFVPVCLPVDNCSLTEPFPCPSEQECTCTDDRACVVVRPDGATACTVPGSGRSGDPCTGTQTAECAYGFVCQPEVGCMKLCSTIEEPESSEDDEPQCPASGQCIVPPEFPSDLGICVGADSGVVAAR